MRRMSTETDEAYAKGFAAGLAKGLDGGQVMATRAIVWLISQLHETIANPDEMRANLREDATDEDRRKMEIEIEGARNASELLSPSGDSSLVQLILHGAHIRPLENRRQRTDKQDVTWIIDGVTGR